ncbi:ABC transporter ATP-binding protein, partial [Nocardia sp. NPDC059228]
SMADFIQTNSRSFVRLRSPQQEQIRDALHEGGFTVVEAGDGALEIDGSTSEEIGELAARHGLVLHELSSQRASLEEAFMQMTAESVEYHAHSAPGTGPAAPAAAAAAPGPGWGQHDNQGKGA